MLRDGEGWGTAKRGGGFKLVGESARESSPTVPRRKIIVVIGMRDGITAELMIQPGVKPLCTFFFFFFSLTSFV